MIHLFFCFNLAKCKENLCLRKFFELSKYSERWKKFCFSCNFKGHMFMKQLLCSCKILVPQSALTTPHVNAAVFTGRSMDHGAPRWKTLFCSHGNRSFVSPSYVKCSVYHNPFAWIWKWQQRICFWSDSFPRISIEFLSIRQLTLMQSKVLIFHSFSHFYSW